MLAHTLPSLQRLAHTELGCSAQDTLDILETLYERGLISYPRTDCGYLPLALYKPARKQVKRCGAVIPNSEAYERHFLVNHKVKGPVWDDAQCTTHHGIIPTDARALRLCGLSVRELQVYNLICERFLRLFATTEAAEC